MLVGTLAVALRADLGGGCSRSPRAQNDAQPPAAQSLYVTDEDVGSINELVSFFNQSWMIVFRILFPTKPSCLLAQREKYQEHLPCKLSDNVCMLTYTVACPFESQFLRCESMFAAGPGYCHALYRVQNAERVGRYWNYPNSVT